MRSVFASPSPEEHARPADLSGSEPGLHRALRVFLYFRSPVSWVELARRTVKDTIADGVPGLAAQLAFYFFLALFPALLFVLSLLSYLPIDPVFGATLERLEAVMPADVLDILREQMDQVLAGDSGGLMTFAIAGAVWSSSAAMTAIISALNRAFDIEEFRPWWMTRITAVWLTIALALFVILAFAVIVGGADLGVWVAQQFGAGSTFAALWRIVQWPLALLLVIIGVDLVYHFAPNADARWVWITPGSLLATGLWLLASLGFKLYVQNFSNYTAVYGAIGSIIVVLLWFYLSGFALLVGAELNAEIHKGFTARDGARSSPTGRQQIGPPKG